MGQADEEPRRPARHEGLQVLLDLRRDLHLGFIDRRVLLLDKGLRPILLGVCGGEGDGLLVYGPGLCRFA